MLALISASSPAAILRKVNCRQAHILLVLFLHPAPPSRPQIVKGSSEKIIELICDSSRDGSQEHLTNYLSGSARILDLLRFSAFEGEAQRSRASGCMRYSH